jgi:hypothetical protein
MRYILSAILACALGMPAASALPVFSANSVSLSKAGSIVQVAKRSRQHATRKSRSGSGGIHPLVGSGDY